MRSIARLFTAFGILADSLLTLGSVVDSATEKLRLQLDGETEAPALPHALVQGNTDGSPSTKRNGRASKATA